MYTNHVEETPKGSIVCEAWRGEFSRSHSTLRTV
jgi:hypothetical protein